MLRYLPILSALMLPLGCGSVKSDVEVLCNMSTVCPGSGGDPAVLATEKAKCVERKIRTSEGKNLVNAMGGVPVDTRPELLRRLAKEHGVGACPEADEMEKKLRSH